ncbi:hypothetical protein [Paraburkholderia bengalensis]|uniref:hypothetical protein n=1 Tax=Paraburkholderia bengalensis TaxID=2747562 RepID=UPI0030155763
MLRAMHARHKAIAGRSIQREENAAAARMNGALTTTESIGGMAGAIAATHC